MNFYFQPAVHLYSRFDGLVSASRYQPVIHKQRLLMVPYIALRMFGIDNPAEYPIFSSVHLYPEYRNWPLLASAKTLISWAGKWSTI
jgi:hypothetical protein